VALGLVNWAIAARERHLRDGRTVFLEIAPVDPRSLMQGDYMALRFWAAPIADAAADGYAVAVVDERRVARVVRQQDEPAPLGPGEIALRYRVRGGETRFATNAFFFQEGDAALYEGARYGEFRVDDDGDLLLTGLRGPALEPLGPRDGATAP
jgi:uncharacterized membrane-anchored protein